MADMTIIQYMKSLVGYDIKETALLRIATERGVANVEDWTTLTTRQRNLVLADMLMYLFTSPSNSGSKSKSHGDFSITIGAQIITDKDDIYNLMMQLYKNPDDDLASILEETSGGCGWMD
jgi:hypothetical protein